MLFNSVAFAIFLPIVFIFYWFITHKSLKFQNFLLLTASYYFYACWDWRFLFLLMFSTLLDYFTGLKMSESHNKKNKKFWLWLSISINLGFLGLFKYYNFFAESFAGFISNFGFQIHPSYLNVILPVGISFYTFHGLSYVFDIFNNKITAEKNFVNYAVFVSFFPLLVAGPIERATHLLPQIQKKRDFNYHQAVDGLRQILWGLFKKIVIADSCAEYANMIFNNSSEHSGSSLLLGVIFFAFQIYGDFSGYSDIALGTAKLFGIELLRNFAYPYFSRDIAEFWRRWHISLSSWFRDYLYLPLGGSRGNMWFKIRNTLIVFVVSGFWHGANWTFIVWGTLNAVFFLPLLIGKSNRKNLDIVAQGKFLPNFRDSISMLITFGMTLIAWVFFRANSLAHAFSYLAGIFSKSIFTVPYFGNSKTLVTIFLIFLFIIIEWFGREEQYAIANIGLSWQRPLRWAFYYSIAVVILLSIGGEQQFIYFQF